MIQQNQKPIIYVLFESTELTDHSDKNQPKILIIIKNKNIHKIFCSFGLKSVETKCVDQLALDNNHTYWMTVEQINPDYLNKNMGINAHQDYVEIYMFNNTQLVYALKCYNDKIYIQKGFYHYKILKRNTINIVNINKHWRSMCISKE